MFLTEGAVSGVEHEIIDSLVKRIRNINLFIGGIPLHSVELGSNISSLHQ
jgi:hypothetical protein